MSVYLVHVSYRVTVKPVITLLFNKKLYVTKCHDSIVFLYTILTELSLKKLLCNEIISISLKFRYIQRFHWSVPLYFALEIIFLCILIVIDGLTLVDVISNIIGSAVHYLCIVCHWHYHRRRPPGVPTPTCYYIIVILLSLLIMAR